MSIGRWLLLLAAGCQTTAEPYEVMAAANLAGTAGIEGPLEVLGVGRPASMFHLEHTVVAYDVRLPDEAPRRLRLFNPGSCDTPPDEVMLIEDLGTIRRVGDEVHFFVPTVIDGRRIEVDTIVATALMSFDPARTDPYVPYFLDMIAVVQDLGEDEPGPPPAPGFPQKGSGTAPWLACGAFTLR